MSGITITEPSNGYVVYATLAGKFYALYSDGQWRYAEDTEYSEAGTLCGSSMQSALNRALELHKESVKEKA